MWDMPVHALDTLGRKKGQARGPGISLEPVNLRWKIHHLFRTGQPGPGSLSNRAALGESARACGEDAGFTHYQTRAGWPFDGESQSPRRDCRGLGSGHAPAGRNTAPRLGGER